MDSMNFFTNNEEAPSDYLRTDLEKTAKGKRKYKDSIFSTVFSTPEAIGDLYRSLNPSVNFEDSDIKVVTLDNSLVNDYYNDLGFMVGNRLIILVEEQSTFCPNMPLRILIYLAHEYEQLIASENLPIYGTKIVEIPAPEFYVISTVKTDTDELRISSAFRTPSNQLELKIPIITEDQFREIFSLQTYLNFVHSVEHNYRSTDSNTHKNKELEIPRNYNNLKEDTIAADVIRKRSDSMISLFEQKFDIENVIQQRAEEIAEEITEEAREEAKLEGRLEGRLESMISLYNSGIITKEQAIKQLEISASEFWDLVVKYS